MTESDKHFLCRSPGCTMSFTNEDQLMLHKKKHDMMLNLNSTSKSAGFLADQTPTPTRFIRNCEEVGLFQDLQNVNPFEETFRRAVESGNTGTLSVPEAGITDDTLHTPHIFPHIADVLSASNQILPDNSVEECSSTISITDKTTTGASTIETEVCASVKLTGSTEQSLLKDTKLTTIDKVEVLAANIADNSRSTTIATKLLAEQATPQLSINGEEVQLLLKTADGKLMQLSAFPVGDETGSSQVIHSIRPQAVVVKTDPPLQCESQLDSTRSRLSLARMKLKQVLNKNKIPVNENPIESNAPVESCHSRKENYPKTVDLTKKKEIQERNRASSMRARAKRKAWIQQLERTVTNVNETNVALQTEIKVLRTEVAKLKTLLLAHKDCPVTKAIQKGNGIVSGSKLIPVSPEVVTLTKRPATSFLQSEIPIVPKKQASVAPMKSTVILPKVDCTSVPISNTTLIKTLPTLKIMNVNQFLGDKEEMKQIIIVPNSSKKLEDSSTRRIIQIKPNYEIGDSPATTET